MEQSTLFCSSLRWVQKGQFGKLRSEGGEREGGAQILSSSVASRNAFLEGVRTAKVWVCYLGEVIASEN